MILFFLSFYWTDFGGVFFGFTMVNFSEVVKCVIFHILSFMENDKYD